ncbi:hypothetical protein T492DRAFT_1145798, partial [Pavlovales sp. CCMP2436]
MPAAARPLPPAVAERVVDSLGHAQDAAVAPLYFLSSDVALPVRLRVSEVRGTFPLGAGAAEDETFAQRFARHVGAASADVHVSCQLFSRGRPLCAAQRTGSTAGDSLRWLEWLSFPAAYRDLGPDAEVRISLFAPRGPGVAVCAGRAVLKLFNERGHLRVGQKELPMPLDAVDSDGAATQSSLLAHAASAQAEAEAVEAELQRVERALRHRELAAARWSSSAASASSACGGLAGGASGMCLVPPSAGGGGATVVLPTDGLSTTSSCCASAMAGEQALPWLDRLVYRELEQLQTQSAEHTPRLALCVELPRIEHTVCYLDALHTRALPARPVVCALPAAQIASQPASLPTRISAHAPAAIAKGSAAAAAAAAGGGEAGERWWARVADEGVGVDEAAQLFRNKLARAAPVDEGGVTAAPDASERAQIRRVLAAPPTHHLSPAEKETLWRFRSSLLPERKALGKFLRCVDWQDPREVGVVRRLLPDWAPPAVDDALELLSRTFAHADPLVRRYAVCCLARASDAQLLSYLLPLVQALRYDPPSVQADGPAAGGGEGALAAALAEGGEGGGELSALAAYLVARASSNFEVAVALHWYLLVEMRMAAAALGLPAAGGGGEERRVDIFPREERGGGGG